MQWLKNKYYIALSIALLFHISGLTGILFSSHKSWFIENTSLNLILMSVLLIITQSQKNIFFWLFFLIAFLTGMVAEIIGVNTSFLFGHYAYGNVMGIKLSGVPLLIGLQWFTMIYCSGITIHHMQVWMENKFGDMAVSPFIKTLSFAVDGALIAVIFDFIMEPVAVKLGFWQWNEHKIPVFNYTCWLLISSVLLFVFSKLKFNKHNHFAIHLLFIQVLFFLALRIYL